jgi:hypothetical protein
MNLFADSIPPLPGQLDGGLLHIGLRAALGDLQRQVQRGGAELAGLTGKVWAPQSNRPHQRLDGAVLGATGRHRLPTLWADRHTLLQHGAMRVLDQAFRHRLGQFLAEGKDGLRQLCQGGGRVLQAILQLIQPAVEAVVQPLPNCRAPM